MDDDSSLDYALTVTADITSTSIPLGPHPLPVEIDHNITAGEVTVIVAPDADIVNLTAEAVAGANDAGIVESLTESPDVHDAAGGDEEA